MIVSIIIPNRNDVSKCAIAIRSAIEEIVNLDAEIIIAENSDREIQKVLMDGSIISKRWKNLQFITQDFPCLFSAFDHAVDVAKGKYIIRLDSDMMCGHDMIADMVKFMEEAPDDIAFGHAPLNFFSQHEEASQHTVSLEFGNKMCRWDGKRKHGESIPYKGMPWIIKKETYGKINGYGCLRDNRLTPFGDPYIGIKAWLLGFKNYAIDCRPGIHLGLMPGAVKFDKFYSKGMLHSRYNSYTTAAVTAYVLCGKDRIKDYAKMFIRVGLTNDKVEKQLDEYVDAVMDEILSLGRNDRAWMKERQVITFDELVKKKPWGVAVKKKNLYWRMYPIWKAIAGKRAASCIKEEDWVLIRSLVQKHGIKSVLEFGSGLSTILFDKLGLDVTSYETDLEFMEKVKRVCSGKVKFVLWDNKTTDVQGRFDCAIVDGIKPRFLQAEIAREVSDIVVVHDVGVSSKGVPEKVLSDCTTLVNKTKRTGVFFVPDKKKKDVSIIISHRNDFPMLGITVKSALEDMVFMPDFGEVIIGDNSGKNEIQNLDYVIAPQSVKEGKVKIIYQDFPCLFTARDKAVEVANGKYIVCLDSHVISGNNMYKDMVDFMETAPENIAFGHAPLMYVNQNEKAKRHEFRTRRYYSTPHKTGIKGMPWIISKKTYQDIGGYGVFSKTRASWGGGDIYMALKPWLLGYENWAIPCRPALHIGPYTKLDRKYYRYRMWGRSGETKLWMGLLMVAYIFGCNEFPNIVTDLRDFHTKTFSQEDWEEAKEFGKEERAWMESRQKMSIEELLNHKPWMED